MCSISTRFSPTDSPATSKPSAKPAAAAAVSKPSSFGANLQKGMASPVVVAKAATPAYGLSNDVGDMDYEEIGEDMSF